MLEIIGLILLLIIKIIGIVLALIIGLILLVLFVPFRYIASGSYDEDIQVKVKFSWLCHFVNGQYIQSKEDKTYRVRIILFNLIHSHPMSEQEEEKGQEEKELVKEKKQEKEKGQEQEQEKKGQKQENEGNANHENGKNDILKIEQQDEGELLKKDNKDIAKKETDQKETVEQDKLKKDKAKKDKAKKDKTKKDKTSKASNDNKKGGIAGVIDSIKEIWEMLNKEENKGIIAHVFKYVFKVLKWILPKKASVNMEIGLEDPAVTGYISGVTSILYVVTKRKITIVPNFQQQIIQGSFKIKGRLFLFQLLYYIIRVIIDKRVRRLIKEIRA